MNQLFYSIAGGTVHKIRRRQKRTTISEVTVRGKREILSKINKIGIGLISIFLLKAQVSYLTILKRKNFQRMKQSLQDSLVLILHTR